MIFRIAQTDSRIVLMRKACIRLNRIQVGIIYFNSVDMVCLQNIVEKEIAGAAGLYADA